MKLPFAKDDDSKRMMSGTSNGRNELLYEAREVNVTGSSAQKGLIHRYTQIEPAAMDLGSGDTPDYSIDMGNHREPFVEEKSFSLVESEHVTQETQIPTYERVASYDGGMRVTQGVQSEEYYIPSKPSHHFRSSEDIYRAAIVEDNHQPNFMARESNPSIPSATDQSKMNTLIMSDRSRRAIDADDDVEKAEDAGHDKSITRHDSGLKTSATTNEKVPDSEKTEKGCSWPENQMNDENTSCPVQCLYYTIECCECNIL